MESEFAYKRERHVSRRIDKPFFDMEETKLGDRNGISNCHAKMTNSLQVLKHEMVQLAYLNVQLMEKMIEMQSQIEAIKQDRMDLMLEEYKSELFEQKVGSLSGRTASIDKVSSRTSSFANESNKEASNDDGVFISGNDAMLNEQGNARPGRKATVDSLSSLPSVSSMQSECSYLTIETENEDYFAMNENETGSSDSGIDIRHEFLELDSFLTATTSVV